MGAAVAAWLAQAKQASKANMPFISMEAGVVLALVTFAQRRIKV
jgi:hypothetical protein